MKLLILIALFTATMHAQRKQGSPLDHLPKNMEVITRFGERADFSPDNQRIAFMAKSFGDAFVIDLKTRDPLPHVQRPRSRVLTDHASH